MENEKQYYSGKYLSNFFKTKSLKFFEFELKNNNLSDREKSVLAGYVFYLDKNKFNEYKYKNLAKLKFDYSKSLKNKKYNERMFKVNESLVVMCNERKNNVEFKMKVQKEVKSFLNKSKLKLRFLLSENEELKYSNVYNFLNKDLYSALSSDKATELFSLVRKYDSN